MSNRARSITGATTAFLLVAGLTVAAPTLTPASALPPDAGYGDVYAINRDDGGKVAVLVSEGSRDYQDFTSQTRTPLDSNSIWRFAIGDFEGDGVSDLYAINPDDGGQTSVHVLSGASDFQTFVAHHRTPLHATTGSEWTLRVADYNGDRRGDLFAINRNDNGRTSVHVLDAASGFQAFTAHEVSGMHETTSAVWEVFAADYNGDAKADLYVVNKNDNGKTAVHVFDGTTGFKYAIAHEISALPHTTDWVWSLAVGDRNVDGSADLFAFNGSDIATENTRTSIHVAEGATRFSTLGLQTVSAIGPVATDRSRWELHVSTRSRSPLDSNQPPPEPTGVDDELFISPRAGQSSTYSPDQGAVFSRPGSGTIHNLIVRNIQETPKGAYIRGVTWSFSSQQIADELIKADREGAVVRILVSRQSRDWKPVTDLVTALGSNCGPGRSCIRVINYSARGSDVFDGKYTTMHQKSWLFSTTGSAKRVSIITSHNATDEARDKQYNDAYQFVRNYEVYNAIRDKFVAQSNDTDLGTPYAEVGISETLRLYFGPWNSPAMADPVVSRINALPHGSNGLVIRVAMAAWQDARGVNIARALAGKKREGAAVFVLAGQPMGRNVRDVLLNANIPIRNAWLSEENYLHSKFMTAKWTEGGEFRHRVWAGSENWGDDPRGSDELVFRVGAGETYADYGKFFNSIYN